MNIGEQKPQPPPEQKHFEAVLEHAYVWDCPNCGVENFQRSVAYVVKGEDVKQIMVARGEIEEWQDVPNGRGMLASAYPDNVICRGCKQMFKAMCGECGCDDDDGSGTDTETDLED